MTLILKKRELDEKDNGYRLLMEDGYNGVYISASTLYEKRIELHKESYEDFKIVANLYFNDSYIGRVTGVVSVEDYDGMEVKIND